MTSAADRYWQQYLDSLPSGIERPPRYVEAFSFGVTAADASEIAPLVAAGTKTATGSVLWSYEADGKAIPRAGDHWIVVDGERAPVCIIQTMDVAIIPFDEVPERYAREGGEGDRTLETWRPMYWRYILSECRRIGREPDPKAPLVMERFAVVYREALREPAADRGSRPSLVFFDLGGVVARFTPERRLPALAALGTKPAARLHAGIWESGLSREFDAGGYSATAMHAKICELLGSEVPFRSVADAWCLAFEPVAEVLDVARALRFRARVGLLSNNPPLLLEALPLHLPQVASVFSPILFSCDLGVLKPEAALFERASRRVGVASDELLLVDDSPANVQAARRAGWHAIHFESVPGLERELSALRLLDERAAV